MSQNRHDDNRGIIVPAFIDIEEPLLLSNRAPTVAQFIYRLGDPPITAFLDLMFYRRESDADRGVNPITNMDALPTWTIHPSKPSTDTSIETHNGYVVLTAPQEIVYRRLYGRIAVSQFYNFQINDECGKITTWRRGSVGTGHWRRA